MKSLVDLTPGSLVKLVVSMTGRPMTITQSRTGDGGRLQFMVKQKWYYADTGNAVNGSAAYITAIEDRPSQ